ncbi:MAG: response regulator [Elusimicrobia bacterium]|nr:response regulator [Elusimicrobiota bacterium]
MRKTHLLIIDDDAAWTRIAAEFFARAGYTVGSAATCAEGLRRLRLARPDAILLDFHLTDGDGGEVCAAVRTDSELKKVPVIMVSADPTQEADAYLLHQADAFALKDGNFNRLVGVVEALLRRVGWERGITEKGDIRLEADGGRAYRSSRPLPSLSPEQFRLFSLLLDRSPAFVTEEEIARVVFNSDRSPELADAIRGLIYRLRLKLGRRLGRRVKNRSGRGWIYLPPRPDKRNSAPGSP